MDDGRERLTYSVGNEHNPADPFGRSELTIEPAGGVRLDHYRLGEHRAWTGRVALAALERLWSALDRAGFPNVADRSPLPADATLCTLAAGDGLMRRVARLAWREALGMPGYREVITLLDDIVRELDGEAAGTGPVARRSIVGDVRRVC
jgi:hypothetical protein